MNAYLMISRYHFCKRMVVMPDLDLAYPCLRMVVFPDFGGP